MEPPTIGLIPMTYDAFTIRYINGLVPGWVVYIKEKKLGPFPTHKQALRAAKKELKATSN